MTIEVEAGVIRLRGACPVGDAERLAAALAADPAAAVDLEKAGPVHSALVQLLLAYRPAVSGAPADPFLAGHVLPSLVRQLRTT